MIVPASTPNGLPGRDSSARHYEHVDAVSYANLHSTFEPEPMSMIPRGMKLFAHDCALFSAFVDAKE
jgi:hypothetical protein